MTVKVWTKMILVTWAVLSVSSARAQQAQRVTLKENSSVVEIRLMFRAGSAHDLAGKEGLAAVTAQMIAEGGFGDPKNPVTKEMLADKTFQYGDSATPAFRIDKETTTFSMTVPKSNLKKYVTEILRPMFVQPLFSPTELDRIREENLTSITSVLRLEDMEALGLEAIDDYLFQHTSYSHPLSGTVAGLNAISPEDLRRFYATYYQTSNLIVGIRGKQPEKIGRGIVEAIRELDMRGDPPIQPFPVTPLLKPEQPKGRNLIIVAIDGEGTSTGIHGAFPLPATLNRSHPDYWPLLVANTYFGTHRDSFSHLYEEIRSKRGFNYGDYSYIEHFAERTRFMVPPFNTPRTNQYFSLWIRPVPSQYGHFVLHAMLWELDHLIRKGLTDDQVQGSKIKTIGIYYNSADRLSRRLQARMDDAFYGTQGYLENYTARVQGVTTEQVNAAIRKYLQADNMKVLMVTDKKWAPQLAKNINTGTNVVGKTPQEYKFWNGRGEFTPTAEQKDILQQDARWAAYPLNLKSVRVVSSNELFETGGFVEEDASP